MRNRNEINDRNTIPLRHHHPWTDLEEYQPDGGMWRLPATHARDTHIREAEYLMADPDRFYAAMVRALDEWPRSCEVAMTTPGLNRRAWIGHAGCYLAVGSPEETTRLGWHRLDDAAQFSANDAADRAIEVWHRQQERVQQLDLWGDGA
jgi:hypothetical protein